MKMILFIFKILLFLKYKLGDILSQSITYLLMKIKLVEFEKGLISNGIPKIFIYKNGRFIIGKNFKINNTIVNNPIGRYYKCIFVVGENAVLKIGDNVGMSGTTIVAHQEVRIGNNVKTGGNVCIYDTDFHSLNANDRTYRDRDMKHTKKKSIFIGENVFIGAHVSILKGVSIGKNSIVGACSVVTKDIPANEIWAGNPARFIRKIDED